MYPLPLEADIEKLEKAFHVVFPEKYKEFLKTYNSCKLYDDDILTHIDNKYAIERFLGIIKDYKEHDYGEYDIGVSETSLSLQERNIFDEDIYGSELIPIAKLAYGDYLCLNYHKDKKNPSVDFLDYEESYTCNPVTTKISDSFTDFVKLIEN
ncbi:SMI1/KNR4 family protein [Bacillus sp. M6-12]|uniref:SMI1/KNR4 family protein n=1 Tax=Bacillus sp. M6-12 TaxID=2054166 RepID=UPI0015E07425|nr:SMI1/KNR4 family protein [Bacillus sp. M6-12]